MISVKQLFSFRQHIAYESLHELKDKFNELRKNSNTCWHC